MNDTEEILTRYGWAFYDKCRCGGVLKHKYRNPDKPGVEIEWQVKRYLFKVKCWGKTIKTLTAIGKLEETLKELA